MGVPQYIGVNGRKRMASVMNLNAFDALQNKLLDIWHEIGTTLTEHYEEKHTVVVIPSITIDMDLPSFTQQAYEERMLFLLFLLRKPDIRVIYVTSQPIQPDIIEYYLELIPGIISAHARKRLFLLSPEDASAESLTQKILDRPHFIQKIRSLVQDFDRAHIVPFNTTDLERDLALKIGLPMYAADPGFAAFGTKSGCRHIFEDIGIQYPPGVEDLYTEDDLLDAIVRLRAAQPGLQRVVVKLNEGVSGLGNLLLELAALPQPGDAAERAVIQQLLRAEEFAEPEATYDDYLEKLAAEGGIVEAFVSGDVAHSPSVQLRLTPLGDVELLSTHDQLLGGADGQSYMGAVFPANPQYTPVIVRDALEIGDRFAREGIMGRFAVDFVVVKSGDSGDWQCYAIEVNLRKGGTTAPFLILQYLTDGAYSSDNGVFTTPYGQPKYYVASDHVESPAYRVFTVDDLMDIVSRHRLHYNHATQTGIVLHIMTGIAELGRVGITAIDNTPEAARQQYEQFVSVLDQEAQRRLA